METKSVSDSNDPNKRQFIRGSKSNKSSLTNNRLALDNTTKRYIEEFTFDDQNGNETDFKNLQVLTGNIQNTETFEIVISPRTIEMIREQWFKQTGTCLKGKHLEEALAYFTLEALAQSIEIYKGMGITLNISPRLRALAEIYGLDIDNM